MKKILIISVLAFYSFSTFAQKTPTKLKTNKKVKYLFSFDSRNAFAFGGKSKMFGIKTGVEIFEKHRMGIGLYGMVENVILTDINEAHNLSSIKFSYVSMFYEYILYENHKWEIAPTIYFGQATTEITNFDFEGSILLDENGNNLSLKRELSASLIGVGVNVEYKIIRFFGIGTGLGYRQIIGGNTTLREALSSPLYILKLKIFLGEFFKKNPNKK